MVGPPLQSPSETLNSEGGVLETALVWPVSEAGEGLTRSHVGGYRRIPPQTAVPPRDEGLCLIEFAGLRRTDQEASVV